MTNPTEVPRARRGRYRGQPIDACRRSIEIVTDLENSPATDTMDSLTVRFFYHLGEYWTGIIPLNSIAEIRGQAFNFSKPKTRPGPQGPEIIYADDGMPKRTVPFLNHVQCRFRLIPEAFVDLYPLDKTISGSPVHRLNDFVYSVEAVGPLGVQFNLRDALNGSLLSAHRFLSTAEMVFERLVVDNQYVTESAAIPLNEDQKRQLLVEALLRGHRAGMQQTYYLYRCWGTNNCTSNPLELIDRVVKYSFYRRIGTLAYRLPLSPRFYLRIRGLDADPTHRKLLREEFKEFIQAVETQQRKRIYVRARVRELREARKQRAPSRNE